MSADEIRAKAIADTEAALERNEKERSELIALRDYLRGETSVAALVSANGSMDHDRNVKVTPKTKIQTYIEILRRSGKEMKPAEVLQAAERDYAITSTRASVETTLRQLTHEDDPYIANSSRGKFRYIRK